MSKYLRTEKDHYFGLKPFDCDYYMEHPNGCEISVSTRYAYDTKQESIVIRDREFAINVAKSLIKYYKTTGGFNETQKEDIKRLLESE